MLNCFVKKLFRRLFMTTCYFSEDLAELSGTKNFVPNFIPNLELLFLFRSVPKF